MCTEIVDFSFNSNCGCLIIRLDHVGMEMWEGEGVAEEKGGGEGLDDCEGSGSGRDSVHGSDRSM